MRDRVLSGIINIMERSEFGAWAEKQAAKFLENRGYRVLDRNYRKPWGEIDLIAKKLETLIFVEVKASQSEMLGFSPEVRANSEKQRKIIRTARTYLAEQKLSDTQEWQIDIISVTLRKEGGMVQIHHFKNI